MISLIVAHSINGVIGKDGKIPWKIKGEQKRFKDLTTGNVVIMGRRTYEEIGKALPDRMNVVISRTKQFEDENLVTRESFMSGIIYSRIHHRDKEIFIIGGSELYKFAINADIVNTMYITQIPKIIAGDTYFPKFDYSRFDCKLDLNYELNDEYEHLIYTRKW